MHFHRTIWAELSLIHSPMFQSQVHITNTVHTSLYLSRNNFNFLLLYRSFSELTLLLYTFLPSSSVVCKLSRWMKHLSTGQPLLWPSDECIAEPLHNSLYKPVKDELIQPVWAVVFMSEAPCYGCVGWWVIVFISIQSAWFCWCVCVKAKYMNGFGNNRALSECFVSVFESCRLTVRHQKTIRSENAQDVSVRLKNAREK